MENFVIYQKRMRAVDGKQEIYLECPNSHSYWLASACMHSHPLRDTICPLHQSLQFKDHYRALLSGSISPMDNYYIVLLV